MAYTPINWQTGDTITAVKLNKMDNGWSIENTQLFSETVTTVAGEMGNSAPLAYTGTDTPDSMNITFDGTNYVCPKQDSGIEYFYGAPGLTDWSQFPFVVVFVGGNWLLFTETAGEHTVSASAAQLEVTDNFRTAVCSVSSPLPMLCVLGQTTLGEMKAAANAGRLLYFWEDRVCRFITSFLNEESATAVTTVPAANPNAETFGFTDVDGTLVFQNFFA